MFPVDVPYKMFTDADGSPLDNGYIYVGEPNKDPASYPVDIFYDEAGTIVAEQPIRTIAGKPVYDGSPANLYVPDSYSMIVLDKNKQLLYHLREPISTSLYGLTGDVAELKEQAIDKKITNVNASHFYRNASWNYGLVGNVTGALRIELNDLYAETLAGAFYIDIVQTDIASTAPNYRLYINGEWGAGSWDKVNAQLITPTDEVVNVRFCKDVVLEKVYVCLGDVTSNWFSPAIVIREVQTNGSLGNFYPDFTFGVVSSLPTIDLAKAASYVNQLQNGIAQFGSGEIGSYRNLRTNASVLNNASVTSANLANVYMNASLVNTSTAYGVGITGTWRNVSGVDLTTGQGGLFLRVE